MNIFLENPEKFVSEFSEAFQDQFLAELAEDQFEWLPASEIYSAILRDPSHIRINATRWPSLIDFLVELESEGVIDKQPDPTKPTTFLVRRRVDPEVQARLEQAQADAKRKSARSKEREALEFEKRIRVTESLVSSSFSEATRLNPTNKKISISLKPKKFTASFSPQDDEEEDTHRVRKESLLVDCIVKLKSGLKGRVMAGSSDEGHLNIELLKSTETVENVTRQEIETVIPNVQKRVKIVNPQHALAGQTGLLESVDVDAGTGKVFFAHLNDSLDIVFDDISKLAVE